MLLFPARPPDPCSIRDGSMMAPLIQFASRWFGIASLMLMGIWLRDSVAAQDSGQAPASDLTKNPSAVPLVAGFERFGRHEQLTRDSAGRLLVTELSCTACHSTDATELVPKRGPHLSGLGNRLDRGWVTRFLLDPATTHRGTTMPDLLGKLPATQRAEAAERLADYLDSLRQPLPEIQGSGAKPVPHRFWELGDREQGRVLYHRVGCVACHAPDPAQTLRPGAAPQLDPQLALLDPEELEELGLGAATRPGPIQPLGDLAAKYSLRSLALFLLEPETIRPALRMPNLKLTVMEAADLAAYLFERTAAGATAVADFSQPSTAAPVAQGDEQASARIEQGRRWFANLGCAACHNSPDPPAADSQTKPAADSLANIVAAKPLAELNPESATACWLAMPSAPTGGPRYGLDPDQTAALVAMLVTLRQPAPPDQTLREALLRSNCYACHERDGLGGVAGDRSGHFETVGHEDLGDEGRLPPPLSGVERKLKPAWLGRFLVGNGNVRPYLYARMPRLADAEAKRYVALFSAVSRGPASGVLSADAPPAGDWPAAADLLRVDVGREMLDAGCVQCHVFRGESLPGVVGIDLAGIADRVQPDWFHAFVLHPAGLKARTRMPTFFPDGVSQNRELLEGDADRQIAAIWGYLSDLHRQPLPAKIEQARGEDFELKPTDRPILLRTFMRDAGPHAIAVGFPRGVHFAFDAERLRLATAWNGRFLDAQGTWFIRSAPPADPLGDRAVRIDREPPFQGEPGTLPAITAPTADPAAALGHFAGFRLDDQGLPTLLYRLRDRRVEDRVTPRDDLQPPAVGLVRRLTLRAAEKTESPADEMPPLRFCLLVGSRLEPVTPALTPGWTSMRNEDRLIVSIPEALASRASLTTSQGQSRWTLPVPPAETRWELRYSW